MANRNTLRSSEVDRLIAACTSARERLVISALLETGLRASQLSRLEDGDLNLAIGELRVVGMTQTISLSPTVSSLLAQEFRNSGRLTLGVRQIQRSVE